MAIDDGRLTREDVARVVDLKAKTLRDDSPLEYFPVADNVNELGGFDNLRRWLERARTAARPEAVELNLPAPKGVLLVGVQGCGKSLAAKAIAGALARCRCSSSTSGALYDKYVGESEQQLAQGHRPAEAMAPVRAVDRRDREGALGSAAASADGGAVAGACSAPS